MGTLRLHPARLAAFTPRAMGNVWSVFDLQLAVYALALVVIGLLMAFTNSGDAPLAGGSLFTRALMWLAIAHGHLHRVRGGRLPLVADLLVAAVPHQHRPAGADHRHRQRHRRRLALGHHPRAPVPVLGGGQGPDGHRAGRLDRQPSRTDHEPVDHRGRRAAGRPAAGAGPHPAGPGHIPGHRRHPVRQPVRLRRQPPLAGRWVW